jgi:predicted AAA+ superfamily ATPase
MILKRNIETTFHKLIASYKIVTITGPRQAGKTTLCRTVFPDKKYYSLEDPDIRSWCETDPRSFLKEISEGAILDEIQRVPDFISYLQTFVDERPGKGQFILTGSNQLHLNEKVTQSLAGRTAMMTLLPFSMTEIQSKISNKTFEEIIFEGFYPGVFDSAMDPTSFYKNYYQTYIERDVTALINLKDRMQFEKFVKLCAGRAGQILSYTGLSNDVGVSVATIQNWISILEASFIVFRLPPFYENFSKRMIKSPKLYFYDVGLLAYLLDMRSPSDLKNHSMRGALFENLVIVDIMKEQFYRGEDVKLYYMRDAKGVEIDLVYKSGLTAKLFEIKSGMTVNDDFFTGLSKFGELFSEHKIKADKYIIYSGEREFERNETQIINYRNFKNS